jgi:hypothetical protein
MLEANDENDAVVDVVCVGVVCGVPVPLLGGVGVPKFVLPPPEEFELLFSSPPPPPPPPLLPLPAPIPEFAVAALNEKSASANCVLVTGGPISAKLTIGCIVGG